MMAASANTLSRPGRLSHRATTGLAFAALATFFASSSAPTPLYRAYEDSFQFSPFVLTIVFGAYALALLAALLTVGGLSDYVGRRPVVLAALALNAVAMVVFISAASTEALIAARLVQGLAAGMATTTLAATVVDVNRNDGPLLNSIAPFAGLTLGTLGSAALVTWGPAPEQLVYVLLLAATLALLLVLSQMPETAAAKPGGLASLIPHVSVPATARRALARVTPVNVASWALGGFYFSLMPSLVRIATGLSAPLIGGAVVATLTVVAGGAVIGLRLWPAARLLAFSTLTLAAGVAVTLAGMGLQSVVLMLAGTVVAGFGFGATFSGVLRTILPLGGAGERAGLLAAYYVESYLAFSVPAIVAGLFVPWFGLPHTALAYGGVVIVLAIASFVAARTAR